jgi:hypothetical protein
MGRRGVVWRKIENVRESWRPVATGFDKNQAFTAKGKLQLAQESRTVGYDGGQVIESKPANSRTAPEMVQLLARDRGQTLGHSFGDFR